MHHAWTAGETLRPSSAGAAAGATAGWRTSRAWSSSLPTREQDDGWGGWSCCGTCKQLFTGRMQQGLAQAWWSRVASNDVDDPDRLAAADGLAGSHRAQGRHEEAETLQAEVLAVEKRVGGEDAPNTRSAAANLTLTYMGQAKCAKTAELQTKVLTMVKQAKGAEHPGGPARHRQPCRHT